MIAVERLVVSPAYSEAGVDPADRPAQPRHTDVEAGVLQLDISDLQAAVTVIISSPSRQWGALSHLTIRDCCVVRKLYRGQTFYIDEVVTKVLKKFPTINVSEHNQRTHMNGS